MALRPCPCIQDSGEKLWDRFQLSETFFMRRHLKQFVPLPSLLIKHNGTRAACGSSPR